MVIISYDIANDKLRTRFSKYLTRFGHRIQYSVFEIDNSNKLLNNIISDIENQFSKKFSQEDSVYIFKLSSSCEIIRYGYAKNEERDTIIIGQLQTLVFTNKIMLSVLDTYVNINEKIREIVKKEDDFC